MEVCKTFPSLRDMALNAIVMNFFNVAVKILRIQKEFVQAERVQEEFVNTLFRNIGIVLKNSSSCHEECRLLLDHQYQEFLKMAESGILNKKSCHCVPSAKRLQKWLEFLGTFHTAMVIYNERCEDNSEELCEFSCCCWCLKYGVKLLIEVVKYEECACFLQKQNNIDDSLEGNSISENVIRFRKNCTIGDTTTRVERNLITWIQEMLYDCAFIACQELKSETDKQILPNFSDKFTELLLNRIENVCLKMSISHILNSNFFQITILSAVVAAVTHPSVTSVYLTENYSNLPSEFLKNTSCLQNIVVLKLKVVFHESIEVSLNNLLVCGLQVMKKLQVFCYDDCTEPMLVVLVKNCKHLRSLNVKNSTSLKDSTSALFAGFRHLKKLNILDTDIGDVASVINALDKTEVDEFGNTSRCSLLLKSFGCNIKSSSQLHMIATKLPNITELKIYRRAVEVDLLLVRNVPLLMSFSVECNSDFQDIQGILSAKGKQLLKLKLRRVLDVDMRAVSENCPALTQLSLKECIIIGESVGHTYVEFPALERLVLVLNSVSYFPKYRYPNIEYIKIHCLNSEVEDIVKAREHQNVKDFVLESSHFKKEWLGEIILRNVKLERFTFCHDNYPYQFLDKEEVVGHFKAMYPRLHISPLYRRLMKSNI